MTVNSAFLRGCYYVGAVVDLVAVVPLVSPSAARALFDVSPMAGPMSEYVGRVAAALMLGWSALLFWGSLRPIERRGLLLITVVPVLVGLMGASIDVALRGAIAIGFMAPLWVFYGIVIPVYLLAFLHAGSPREERRS